MSVTRISPKRVGEIITIAVDFAAITLTPTAPVVTARGARGNNDPSPQSIVSGSPVVVSSTVLQRIAGGIAGLYAIDFQIDDASNRYIETVHLQIIGQEPT